MADGKIIFAGPSFAGLGATDDRSVTVLPPCRQGDIYLATLDSPSVIGIVDGYFEGQPSVWHKEILWALSCGIHVVGSASMGALRAAETDSFGMKGIGAIYQWYRDGTIEDDDEVALLHGPGELNYPTLSLAMVNVRATLAEAEQRKVISGATSAVLFDQAKAQFYKVRNWPGVVDATRIAVPAMAEELDAFGDWVAGNAVDQKSIDARALLDFVTGDDFAEPFQPAFEFELTEFWHRCTRKWEKSAREPVEPPGDDGYRLFG